MRHVMTAVLLLGLATAMLSGCGGKKATSEKSAASPDMNAKANALKASGMNQKWTQNPGAAKSGAGGATPAPAVK